MLMAVLPHPRAFHCCNPPGCGSAQRRCCGCWLGRTGGVSEGVAAGNCSAGVVQSSQCSQCRFRGAQPGVCGWMEEPGGVRCRSEVQKAAQLRQELLCQLENEGRLWVSLAVTSSQATSPRRHRVKGHCSPCLFPAESRAVGPGAAEPLGSVADWGRPFSPVSSAEFWEEVVNVSTGHSWDEQKAFLHPALQLHLSCICRKGR